MWRVLRPDALSALRDKRARKSLKRYFAVMEGRLPARFLVCRRIPVNSSLSESDEELWRAHDLAHREFKSVLERIDRGKLKLADLEEPEVSLLDLKIELAKRILKSCHFCEHRCGVDRTSGERGFCGVGAHPRVASEFMHYGEEGVLVPSYTIFFSGCTFKCCFCQNWDISQDPEAGVEIKPTELAKLIADAKKNGARNVNFVGGNPDPNLCTILETLRECEVNLSSVWNSNMYYSIETAKLLSGTQDVYLTDFKWGNNGCALKYSKVQRYLEVVKRNHKLAFSDSELIIRHLVMPGHLDCCTKPILEWIADELDPMVRVNVMAQYRPCYRAGEYEEINRGITAGEFARALEIAKEAGLENLEP